MAVFMWGFLAQREKIFPHAILRRIAVRAGIKVWQKHPLELESVPPDFATAVSIPYLDSHVDSSREAGGVVLARENRMESGFNFFSVPGQRAAYLIDMHGKLLWRWTLAHYSGYSKIEPNLDIGFTHLYPNGDVLAFIGKRALLRLDKSSNILWQFEGYVHHDAWVCPDGSIFTLVKHERIDRRIHPEAVLLVDSIAVLSNDGRPQGEFSLMDVLGASPYAFLLRQPPRETVFDTLALDVFHANHVEVYDGRLERMSPLFRKGNILVSLKDNDSIMILDGLSHRILWLWGPMNLTLQHHPTILENGDILLFDNGLKHSRIVEVDPRTNGIVWTYSSPDASFFSQVRGSCQRLANGNTLICVSEKGYALEVTPEGEVAWKYVIPATTGGNRRETILRMTRFNPHELEFLRVSSAP
jgi:outer membrane protein assembly factor BamB